MQSTPKNVARLKKSCHCETGPADGKPGKLVDMCVSKIIPSLQEDGQSATTSGDNDDNGTGNTAVDAYTKLYRHRGWLDGRKGGLQPLTHQSQPVHKRSRAFLASPLGECWLILSFVGSLY